MTQSRSISAQNLSSDFVRWSCAVATTTTPHVVGLFFLTKSMVPSPLHSRSNANRYLNAKPEILNRFLGDQLSNFVSEITKKSKHFLI